MKLLTLWRALKATPKNNYCSSDWFGKCMMNSPKASK